MDDFSEDAARMAAALAAYIQDASLGRGPIIRQEPAADILADLDAAGLAAEGGLTGERLEAFIERYLHHTTRLHHPACMGHQVGVPNRAAALGAFLEGAVNNPMNIYEMGPAAAALELFVLNWMLGCIGWPRMPVPPEAGDGGHAGGVLTHGGSAANLTALAAARARIAPHAWRDGAPNDLIVLAPPTPHYSIQRACGVLGLGSQAARPLEGDEKERIRPGAVVRAVHEARERGERVMAVVANACSTAAGLYDPLAEIAAACRESGVWFHVDGAHGASVLVSPRLRGLMTGAEQADSMIWDAHKMLRTPSVCAAVLMRRSADLDATFHQDASYLFHEKDEPGVDFIHRSLECTKAGLGLKLFMALADEGEAGFARYVERQCDLAHEAADLIEAAPDFELAVRPQSNIVLFRHAAHDASPLEQRRRLLAEGRFYITSTEFAGRRWLRLAFMNPDTTLDHVAALLDAVRRMA